MQELSKSYGPREIEKKWYAFWESEKYFKPQKGLKGETYCIIMPPPNVTGLLHAGHALDITLQDALVRLKRMQGYETLFIPGIDHAGIATQNVVEKHLFEKEGKSRHDYSREAFIEKVWQWKEQYGGLIAKQQKLMGASADWDISLFTMDADANEAVKKVFVELYNEGLIYQADYIVNWDVTLESAISDAEVEYREVQGAFYHIVYEIKESTEYIEIATTRPETLFGDTAVCVHPDDERFNHLIGKKAVVPLCQREVPIIADQYVDREKGTGCLKVTPGHDFNDFDIGRRHKLPIINILNKDGTLNENAPDLQGLSVSQGRKLIAKLLSDKGKLIQIKQHTHKVGHGDRSGAVIEPLISKQWFLNVQEMASTSVEEIENGHAIFWPSEWKKTYFSWMKNPQNWCISRQLWWGHRIPVFYCQKQSCGHSWAETDPTRCPKCKSHEFEQDPDVLDTWFSSALWPFSTLGWPIPKKMEEKKFKKFFPTSTLVTGFDIIFFWVARMMMMSLKFHKQVPFKDIYIHSIVRDKRGRKMSKSLGNGIDPVDMVEQYGADAFRFTLASGSGYNRTLNLDPSRIEGYRNFMNKIWNAFRFIHPFLLEEEIIESPAGRLHHHEKWILFELNETTKKVRRSFDRYRFDDACRCLHQFVYEKFCSWFIEVSKIILYGEDLEEKKRRIHILHYSFKQVMALLHPVCPFITEEIWDYLHKTATPPLIVSTYPVYCKDLQFSSDGKLMNKFIEVVQSVRNLRQSMHKKPKEEIALELFTKEEGLADYFLSQKKVMIKLCKASRVNIHPIDAPKPSKSFMAATNHTDIFLPLADSHDINIQLDRLRRELTRAEQAIVSPQRKLHNKKFLQNAKEDVIAKVQKEFEGWQNQIQSLKQQLKNISD